MEADRTTSKSRQSPPSSSSSSSLGDSYFPSEVVHQLCLLLCSDFPFSLVRNAARITTDTPTQTAGSTSTPAPVGMNLRDFSHKLFVLFYYSEFLNQCALAFRSLDTNGTGRVSRVNFLQRLRGVLQTATAASTGATTTTTTKSGSSTTASMEFQCPPKEAIEASLAPPTNGVGVGGSADEVMFNSFCVDLFAHPLIKRELEE